MTASTPADIPSATLQGGYNPIRPWVSIEIGNTGQLYSVPFKYFNSLTVTEAQYLKPPEVSIVLEDTAFTELYPALEQYYAQLNKSGTQGGDAPKGVDSPTEEEIAEYPEIRIQWGMVGISKTGASRMLTSPLLCFALLEVDESLQQSSNTITLKGITQSGARLMKRSGEVFKFNSAKDLLAQIAEKWKIDIFIDPLPAASIRTPALNFFQSGFLGAGPRLDTSAEPRLNVSNQQRISWFAQTVLPLLISPNGLKYRMVHGARLVNDGVIRSEGGNQGNTAHAAAYDGCNAIRLEEYRDPDPRREGKNPGVATKAEQNIVIDKGAGHMYLEWRDFRSRIMDMNFSSSGLLSVLLGGVTAFHLDPITGDIAVAGSGSGTVSSQLPVLGSAKDYVDVFGHADALELTKSWADVHKVTTGSWLSEVDVKLIGNPQVWGLGQGVTTV